MKTLIKEIIGRYGIFVIAGAVGAVINRLRRKMSWKRFIASIIISVFVALCVGVICRDFFHLQESITYVLCGVFGTFSEAILDEIQELISKVTDIVENRLKK